MANKYSSEGSGRSIPSVAVRWIIHNASSNVELASLSNISRRWRETVAQCVVDTASTEGDGGSSPVARLLLPSLIRYAKANSNSVSTQPEEIQRDCIGKIEDTYCIAWFHPDGIRFKPIKQQNPEPGRYVDVLHQWNSYSDAFDVLSPFGYSEFLIRVSIFGQ